VPPLGGFAQSNPERPYNPFVSWDFLSLRRGIRLRRTARTGWQGHHLRLEKRRTARLLGGLAPAIAKSHSQGEYVFDHGWADAFQRAGGRLLSQAPDRFDAVHAGDRPAPAGCSRGQHGQP
jgi:predicted N-acyltransferase